ncbi:MAG: hypothetical protein LC742_09310 [Acidobacteria bacterium]|nr:hypothetical protein [Acidobacteriota bacterium]
MRFIYIIALLGSLLTADLTTQAQTASPTTGGNTSRASLRRRGRGVARREPATTPPVAPVTVVPQPAPPAYLFGQAQVTVRGNEDPIIRLGLAQHGPIVVEFPASDNFFAVHPGGSQIVTYDESPTLATDHYLVFRAGSGFLSGVNEEGGNEARASISVQMQSGLFVTFLFYPVRDVARMAHRCVVSYSRDEVVTARRAAGLAINLDGRTPQASATPSPGSRRIGGGAGANDSSGDNSTPQTAAGVLLESGELVGSAAARPNSNRRRRESDLPRDAQRALREAIAAPARFNRWSAPVQGLSVSATQPVDLDDQRRITIVAVRNTTQSGLRVLAGGPDLDLQTLGDGGQVVQMRPITRLHVEASTLGGTIPAGATIYYAIIYETPVLDAAQRVRLSVAQTSAADQPASTELSRTN